MNESTERSDKGILNGRRKSDVWMKAFITVYTVLLTISSGLHGWTLLKVMDFEIRVTKIEANRFTADDGRKMMDRIYGLITELRTDLVSIREAIPKEVPPKWFEEIVRDNRNDIRKLKERFPR